MDFPALLTATPEQVAEVIVRAVRRRSNVVYVGRMWRFAMLLIRALPEEIFKRMKL